MIPQVHFLQYILGARWCLTNHPFFARFEPLLQEASPKHHQTPPPRAKGLLKIRFFQSVQHPTQKEQPTLYPSSGVIIRAKHFLAQLEVNDSGNVFILMGHGLGRKLGLLYAKLYKSRKSGTDIGGNAFILFSFFFQTDSGFYYLKIFQDWHHQVAKLFCRIRVLRNFRHSVQEKTDYIF